MNAVVTDDMSTYKPVVDELGLEYQICVTHARKNAARRLRKVRGWQEWKSRLRMLLDELLDDGGSQLIAMERKAGEDPALLRLAVDLWIKWRSLPCHKRMRGVCDTNNVTERVIGRSKIRYKKDYKGLREHRRNDERAVLTQRIWGSPAWTWAICWPRSG